MFTSILFASFVSLALASTGPAFPAGNGKIEVGLSSGSSLGCVNAAGQFTTDDSACAVFTPTVSAYHDPKAQYSDGWVSLKSSTGNFGIVGEASDYGVDTVGVPADVGTQFNYYTDDGTLFIGLRYASSFRTLDGVVPTDDEDAVLQSQFGATSDTYYLKWITV